MRTKKPLLQVVFYLVLVSKVNFSFEKCEHAGCLGFLRSSLDDTVYTNIFEQILEQNIVSCALSVLDLYKYNVFIGIYCNTQLNFKGM